MYETNSAAADSSFLSVSKTLTLLTPAAASTLSPLPTSTGAALTHTSLSVGVTISLPSIGSIDTSLHAGSEPTTTTAGTSSSSTAQAGANGAVGLRVGDGGRWGVAALAALWLGVGGLMVWL